VKQTTWFCSQNQVVPFEEKIVCALLYLK